jgi:hypothetical protein
MIGLPAFPCAQTKTDGLHNFSCADSTLKCIKVNHLAAAI